MNTEMGKTAMDVLLEIQHTINLQLSRLDEAAQSGIKKKEELYWQGQYDALMQMKEYCENFN